MIDKPNDRRHAIARPGLLSVRPAARVRRSLVRVRYVIPGPMGRSAAGATELRRRQELLYGWARADTDVTVVDSATGPTSIESGYEDHLAVPLLASALAEAEQDQVEAMIIGCYD